MDKQDKEDKKDITYLIQYRGGGYDGCFWEWNYSIVQMFHARTQTGEIRIRKEFYDVFSSGRNARKSIRDLRGVTGATGTYIYDCNDEESIGELIQESNAAHVKGVLKFLESELGIEPENPCPMCEQDTEPDNMILGDFSGNGGIGVEAHSWHCHECDALHHCDICNEFNSTTKKRDKAEMDELGEFGQDMSYYECLCDFCYEWYFDPETGVIPQAKQETKKSQIEDSAWHDGYVLGAWYDYYGGIACDCIRTGKRFTVGASVEA